MKYHCYQMSASNECNLTLHTRGHHNQSYEFCFRAHQCYPLFQHWDRDHWTKKLPFGCY